MKKVKVFPLVSFLFAGGGKAKNRRIEISLLPLLK